MTDSPILVTLAIAGFLAVLHIYTRTLRERFFASDRLVNSLLGGTAVAYVFLLLLPNLETTHEVLGESMYLVVLAGFLLFYGLEHLTHSIERRGTRTSASSMTFWIRVSFLWVYNWLFVYTLPDRVSVEGTALLALTAFAIGLSVVFEDDQLAQRDDPRFHRSGRWVLASAPIVGGLVDVWEPTPHPVLTDVLTALLVGFILLAVFNEELPDHDESDFRWFLGGVLLYVLLFFGHTIAA